MNGSIGSRSPLLWIGIVAFAAMSVLCVMNIWHLVSGENASQPLILTSVMMVGLALIVALVILLLIFFKATDNDDKSQALALPSGSIRALIALALVLMFVCLGVYLYQGITTPGPEIKKANITQPQVDALKAQFDLVVVQQANPPTDAKNVARFDATYYPGRSKEADDFAKQMFTQLATVFVTVIGFYFGSSTAAAGVGTGVAAANTLSGKTQTPNSGVPGALQEAKAMTHDADLDLARIKTTLSQLGADSTEKSTVQAILDDTQKIVDAIHAKVQTAVNEAAKFGTASTDAENNAAAANVIRARDEIKPFAEAVKVNADNATSKAPAAPKAP